MEEFGKITIRTGVSEDFSTGELEVFVTFAKANTADEERADTYLWAYLTDEDGKEADRIFPVEAKGEADFCMRVEQPKLWDAQRCCLYDLVLEVRDDKNTLFASAVKKIAFRSWSIREDGIRFLNGKRVLFAADRTKVQNTCQQITAGPLQKEGTDGAKNAADDGEKMQRAQLGKVLGQIKRAGKNAVCVKKELQSPLLHEMCLEYGLYLLAEEPDAKQMAEELPGFEIQVVEQGALIENHSLFADAADYEILYEIREQGTGKIVQSGCTGTTVPPEGSRFVELPFRCPQESGAYRYRVSLCLKKDVPWAKKGTAVAAGETVIANLWNLAF